MKGWFPVGGAAILVAVLVIGIRHGKTSADPQGASSGGREGVSNSRGHDSKRAGDGFASKRERDRGDELASSEIDKGLKYGRYIADQHMPLDELMLELEKLKKRLPAEDFHRVTCG